MTNYEDLLSSYEERLSSPDTKKGRLQRACLRLVVEHRQDGAIPTSIRFIFYELEGRGIIPKQYLYEDGSKRPRQPNTDVSEAMMHLREEGIVLWSEVVDETRTLHNWAYAGTVFDHVENELASARIDLWDGEPPPLILCESRSLAGVLRSIAATYLAPIAATNGQTGGFLHTDIGPLVKRAYNGDVPVRVLYLGDLDLSGDHIEENTRRVLQGYADLDWRRIAITEEQVRERSLTKVDKKDKRYKPARPYRAVETEALKQTVIQSILRDALDKLVPQPLEEVLELEKGQRVLVREALTPLHENGHGPPNPFNVPDLVVEHLAHKATTEAARTMGTLPSNIPPDQRRAIEAGLRRRVARKLLRD